MMNDLWSHSKVKRKQTIGPLFFMKKIISYGDH